MRRYWNTVLLSDYEGERFDISPTMSDHASYKTKAKLLRALYAKAHETFKAEYGYNINRVGEYLAFGEWLSGLALSVDYENYKILEIAKKLKQPVKNESQQQKILSIWWVFLTTHFFKSAKHYKAVLQ
jgi:hypothetical protein